MTESATSTVEQGVKVFQISDYEWIAADSLDSAISCALKEWGMTREEAFGDGIDFMGTDIRDAIETALASQSEQSEKEKS